MTTEERRPSDLCRSASEWEAIYVPIPPDDLERNRLALARLDAADVRARELAIGEEP